MARKLRLEYPGAICHVMFRGDRGNSIFGDDDDLIRLTQRMAESAGNFGVRVCLKMHIKQSESPETIISDVCGRLSVSKKDVFKSRSDATNRAIPSLALLRRCGKSQGQT